MKSRKLVKILGASGLAIMMGVGTLCGVLIAPVAGATASSNAGDLAASAQLGDSALSPEEQAKAELDANIINSGSKGLGLDPENDPIVATTDWGLDIQFHAAGEGTWKSSMSTNGSVSSSALSGYLYFTGGTYSNVSLKWVIIGYSTNTATGPVAVPGTNVSSLVPDSSPAGSSITSHAASQQVYVNSYKSPTFTNAVGNAEIPAGCVLCISEKNLLNAVYTSAYGSDAGDGYYYGARWVKSDLRTTMSNLCNSGIAGFDTIRAKIQTVSLNTYSYRYKVSDGTQAIGKDTSSDKFFALANSTYGTNDAVHYNTSTYPQNYRLETYLGATYASYASKRISYTHNTTTAYRWWLRSGISSFYYGACFVNSSGCVDGYSVNYSYGVRPAFVLKL